MGKKVFSEPLGLQKAKLLRRLSFATVLFFAGAIFTHSAEQTKTGAENSQPRSLSIDGYFDPAKKFISATVRMRFAGTSSQRCLWLPEELDLSSVRCGTAPVLDFKRDSDLLIVEGPGQNELELSYSGRLVCNQNSIAASGGRDIPQTRDPLNDCYFISYGKDFLPHPLADFTPMDFNISVPSGWNCLGSGILRSVHPDPAGKTYIFDNAGSKGMAFIFGNFCQIGSVAALIPIRLHGWPDFQYKNFYAESELVRILSFYSRQFGDLDLPELNVLFRSGRYFSGSSYNGLMVLNVDESWARLSLKERKKTQGELPMSLIDARIDLLAHEMAHQWWGGLVSWKTPADNWITEGLATYSTLLFLREWQGEKTCKKILKKLRRQVKRYAKMGVPADGANLKLKNRDLMVYQALVYAKPALMLLALADTIGEAELGRRLRTFLKNSRGSCVDTAEFLAMLSNGDKNLQGKLEQWICSQGLPAGLV
jgi:hypothetical protein